MIELDVIDASEAQRDKHPPKEKHWRSWGDLTDDPAQEEIAQNEFMDGAAKPPSGPSRREFMKLMGASMALAGLTACRRPAEKILPYARPPEEVIPGAPLYYATSMPFRGVLRGLLVESHEGRPTKVEGNPEHPVMQGKTSPFEQASVLNLYDPDRSRTVLREGREASWQEFLNFCQEFSVGAASRRVVVLAEPASSPTLEAVRERLQERYPQLQWIEYAPEGDDAVRRGLQEAFGQPLRPLYRFDEAEVIVSLDSDFLGPTAPNFVGNARRFAESRRLEGPDDEMSRLYAVESAYSSTGGQADNRLRLKASRIPAFAQALGAALGVGGGGVSLSGREERWVNEIAQDLEGAAESSVVLAGETQPPEVHALCAAINSQLGSVGSVMMLLDTGEEAGPPQSEVLADLVSDMEAGQVDALLMVGANPVHDLPPQLGFAEAMSAVDETIHLGLHIDETAQRSRWHLPRAHYLESWGDGRAYDGTLSLIQPLIAPLYDDAHSEIEVLNAFATGEDRTGYDLVREGWRERLAGNFEREWRRLLHRGFLPNSSYPTTSASASGAPDLSGLQEAEELELVFRLDPKVLSGEYANNAWMQELPDPVTKNTWGNVAVMSRQTAEDFDLDVEYDAGRFFADVVELSVGERSVELPIWIQPGYPDGSIGLTLGYGRSIETQRETEERGFFENLTKAYEGVYERGEALANDVGTNVAPLRPVTLGGVVTEGVELRETGETQLVASTQEHGSMEGRPLVRRATLEEYRENPDFASDAVHMLPGVEEESWEEYPTLWQDDHPSDQPAHVGRGYYENQWGMVIDLNMCTGCNACVVACQSENNVPVVGEEQVARGREMHWLRIDRYYVTEEEQAAHVQEPAAPEGGAAGEEGAGDEQVGRIEEAPETEEEAVEQEPYEAFDDPQMVMQPMLCQHCENAPCEPVCPVAATSHSSDGINEMTYNRCIGTRYCSNNCPYKVRRFNWYNWTKSMPTTVQMAMNPDVTVRFRGVMEKCTFCVQRVRSAQRRAKKEDRRVRDGEVMTACQQACPSSAITFGDINDANSDVSRLKQSERRYEVLAELNTKPRLSYLGRVTNPNPELEEA